MEAQKFAIALIQNARCKVWLRGVREYVSKALEQQQEELGSWDRLKLLEDLQKQVAASKVGRLNQSEIFAIIAEPYIRDEERFNRALKDMHKVKIN
jgi:hypothetical protein